MYLRSIFILFIVICWIIYNKEKCSYTGINWIKKVDKNRWLNNLLLKLYYPEKIF